MTAPLSAPLVDEVFMKENLKTYDLFGFRYRREHGETTNEACLPVWMRSVEMPTTTLPDLGADLSYESGQERDVTSPARVEHPRGEARARTQKKKSWGVLWLER
ncbi:hypothetical protein TNCV_3778101 [Trichonephila clavipes]|nr:hypothetical protein TNCV_3778101 [Trichonephila clavipes]